MTYEESKKIIIELNIKTEREYKIKVKENKIPNNIPNKPSRFYKNRDWISWGDFLKTGTISNNYRIFKPYNEFKEYLKLNKIKKCSEFYTFRKKMDKKFPTNPNIIYKNKGWTCWNDLFDIN